MNRDKVAENAIADDIIVDVLRDSCDLSTLKAYRIPTHELVMALPPECIHTATRTLQEMFEVSHLSAITGQEREEGVELLYHFWDGTGLTLRTTLAPDNLSIASITDLIPGAVFYEREIVEMLHVEFQGHPDPRPLFLPDDWAGTAPMRVENDAIRTPSQQAPPAVQRAADGRLIIPVGPQHPALKEPLSFRLSLEGERIVDSVMRIGYVHRGIERLAQQRSYIQNVHLMERVCGICSHIHTTTYCQGVEILLGLEVPPRAEYLRTLLCELERIHSHMLWLGALAENIGFTTIFMYAWRDREIVLDIMEELSGQRISHAVNIIGGVRIDITSDQQASIMARLADLEEQLTRFLDLVEHEPSFRVRLRHVGYLSAEQIRRDGVVGPMARASGIDVDIRRDVPYAAYDRIPFEVMKDYEGDIWARTVVRLLEAIESLHICRRVLKELPEGPLSVRARRRVPEGEVIVRTEAPRGELLYYIRSDGSDKPARLKIRTPTLTSLITLREQMQDVNVADLPAVLGGMDLCIACADR
jgi:NADH-quinone oxidoreductase subunit D